MIESFTFSPTTTKSKLCLLVLIGIVCFSSVVHAEPFEDNKAEYSIGVSSGRLMGNGIVFRKYFDDKFAHIGAMFIYQAEGDSFSDLSFTIGRYFHRETLMTINLPVGFKAFTGAQYDNFDQLHAGIGMGVDLFNPGTKGIGLWAAITYTSNIELNEMGVGATAGLTYNW